mmetsp:Transcript_6389/g.15316  ORF Transcript_6389/g.15316 Transcript_6389/m.15316 type:complete len:218 (-) Transcript_6389:555-1208(-)
MMAVGEEHHDHALGLVVVEASSRARWVRLSPFEAEQVPPAPRGERGEVSVVARPGQQPGVQPECDVQAWHEPLDCRVPLRDCRGAKVQLARGRVYAAVVVVDEDVVDPVPAPVGQARELGEVRAPAAELELEPEGARALRVGRQHRGCPRVGEVGIGEAVRELEVRDVRVRVLVQLERLLTSRAIHAARLGAHAPGPLELGPFPPSLPKQEVLLVEA